MVELTRMYFETCSGYRRDLRKIWEQYNVKLSCLERYKGSTGYADDKAKIDKDRSEAIEELQKVYQKRFNNILCGMREAAKSRAMIPPTTEQLNLLTVLRMRDSVSRDELEQAGNSLRGCPVGLGVLEEIAEKQAAKNGGRRYGLRFEGESTAGILSSIDALTESALRICALDKCDSRGEKALQASPYNPDYKGVDALYTFRIDRDVADTAEAMSYFVNVQNLDAFENAVNEY